MQQPHLQIIASFVLSICVVKSVKYKSVHFNLYVGIGYRLEIINQFM